MLLSRTAACRAVAALTVTVAVAVTSMPLLAASRQAGTVLELAAGQKNLSTFTAAVHNAGLDGMLNGTEPVTVLAPTDEAFARLAPAAREALLAPENRAKLRDVMLGHVVRAALVFHDADAGNITSGTIETAGGRMLAIVTDDRGETTIGGARLVKADLHAGNGVLSTVDRVLLP